MVKNNSWIWTVIFLISILLNVYFILIDNSDLKIEKYENEINDIKSQRDKILNREKENTSKLDSALNVISVMELEYVWKLDSLSNEIETRQQKVDSISSMDFRILSEKNYSDEEIGKMVEESNSIFDN